MSEEDTNANNPPEPHGFQVTVDHIMERKIESLLWFTRLSTILFTILSLVPLFGVSSYGSYQRALMSSAATSALRLHQRMPRVQFTREFGALLLVEDSCHYLLYSILFIMSSQITLSLLPVFMFAILHSVNYTRVILSKLGWENRYMFGLLSFFSDLHHFKILKLIAFAEVFLMPLTVLWIFSGKGSIVTPFAYYRFLTLRYASRRNPYSRNVFNEMRRVVEAFALQPGQSQFIKNICFRVINFVCYLAPPMPAQQ